MTNQEVRLKLLEMVYDNASSEFRNNPDEIVNRCLIFEKYVLSLQQLGTKPRKQGTT